MTARVAGWRRAAAAAGRPALLGLAVLALAASAPRAEDAPPSHRVALVIGEGAYRSGPLPAAPDDAGLVAQVLAGAGFDVTGARDLDGDAMRRAFRDFLDRAGAAGPDGIAVVYVAGRAIQSDGDDFIVPIDARLGRPADVPIEALRLGDFTHALAALPIQARVVIVDGAYAGGPASGAPGLALMEAEQGELLAFNAAPGTVAPVASGPYGVYAQALVAAIQQGGVPVNEVFDRLRLAVNQATGGALVPWDSNKLTRSFGFFDRAPGAPALASAQVPFAALEKRPLRDFPPDQAYDVAVARDTLPAYAEFLIAFPNDPLARRVRLLQAARREALFWRAALDGNVPGAFWTYLARYPRGPHAADARRRLTRLAAAGAPPPTFVPLGFDLPPPGPDEVLVGPVLFDGPDLPPPPPPPVFLLPPPVTVVLARPARPHGPGFLPVPVPVAMPFVRPPADPGRIAPPRGIRGEYPHPRPYARGPNGDGLVVPTSPPSEARPRPTVSTLPSSPVVPAAVPPVPPPAARAPVLTTAPVARPVASPVQPAAPALPVPPGPPAAGERRGAPASPHPAPAPIRPAPGGTAGPPPAGLPVTPPTPTSPAAAAAAAVVPNRRPPPKAPQQVLPVAPRADAPVSRPETTPQHAVPHPVPVVPAMPRPAAPERPPATAPAPRPPAPEHPGPGAAAAHPANERHPACGHPGEPPCRP